MDGYTLAMLKDTHLGMIQTQTMLMSNKLRETLEICKCIKTTVNYTDKEMSVRKSEDNIFACKAQCRGSSLVPGWSSAAVQSRLVSVLDSASVTELLLYSTFHSTFPMLFIPYSF